MANKRKKYTDAQQTILLSQVNRVCPLCTEPLYYKKKGRSYKSYEIAHIYPLNPTPEEVKLLKDEERLGDDVNDEDNVIPLCEVCHGKFDKPRTVAEYRQLLALKKKIIAVSKEQEIWKTYKIEDEISQIIDSIYQDPDLEVGVEIELNPKAVDEKFDDTISKPTQRKIKNHVSDYYVYIKERFAVLDEGKGDLSEIISLQIKTYYLKQKGMGHSQQAIFDNIVSWIHAKTNPQTTDAAEIIASFFVQNCEVFE